MAKKELTERENFFLVYNHQTPAWTPQFQVAYAPMGASVLNNQGEYLKGGKDMFGVNWICTEDTGWQAIADPFHHVMTDIEDICHWRDFFEFPDLDAMDWEGAAARDTARIDRNEQVVCCFGMEGNFGRLQSLMGTCEAMIAMIDEPEAVMDFFEAHTKFKCETIKKIAKYYKPDIYVNGDDVCTSEGLLFSKNMYDEMIKPFEMQLGKTVLESGLILEHHLCGKADDLIPDILETGATIWQTAQVMNDLVKIEETYGDRLLINGGWDSTADFNYDGASEEAIRAAVRDSIDKYGRHGHYVFFPIIMGDPANPEIARRKNIAMDECKRYGLSLFS